MRLNETVTGREKMKLADCIGSMGRSLSFAFWRSVADDDADEDVDAVERCRVLNEFIPLNVRSSGYFSLDEMIEAFSRIVRLDVASRYKDKDYVMYIIMKYIINNDLDDLEGNAQWFYYECI